MKWKKNHTEKGQVQVNGAPAKKPELKVDPEKDTVILSGETVGVAPEFVYYLLNKPAGCVSATEDRNDRTVMEYVPSDRKGIFPVGRLDKDTEGLLLITDDGDFAHSITSPKKHVDKKYVAKLDGEITEDTVKAFSDGIEFSDGTKCRSAVLECDENDKKQELSQFVRANIIRLKKCFVLWIKSCASSTNFNRRFVS